MKYSLTTCKWWIRKMHIGIIIFAMDWWKRGASRNTTYTYYSQNEHNMLKNEHKYFWKSNDSKLDARPIRLIPCGSKIFIIPFGCKMYQSWLQKQSDRYQSNISKPALMFCYVRHQGNGKWSDLEINFGQIVWDECQNWLNQDTVKGQRYVALRYNG